MTEDSAVRPRQLDAVRRAVFVLAVIPVVALFFPAQILTAGIQRAVCWAVLTLLMGRLLVDCTLTEWRSIPFTCASAPGKRHIIPTMTTGRVEPVLTDGACARTRSPVAATATPAMTPVRTNFRRLISVMKLE